MALDVATKDAYGVKSIIFKSIFIMLYIIMKKNNKKSITGAGGRKPQPLEKPKKIPLPPPEPQFIESSPKKNIYTYI